MTMTSTTYPAYPVTYPPGVLTGRPMEMFEASPTLDLYATPEQWLSNKDQDALQELCDAIDQEKEEEMDLIEQQLQLLEGFQDKTGYYMYPMSLTDSLFSSFGIKESLRQFEEDFDYEEFLMMNNIAEVEVDMDMEEVLDVIDQAKDDEMDWIQMQLQLLERYQDETVYCDVQVGTYSDNAVIVLHNSTSSGIKEALEQFEEDFDYEESLVQEKLKNTEVNFHRLLATPPEDRTGWCGESSYQEPLGSWSLIKERYRLEAKVVHDFPSSRQGYALCETVYGKIYIPEKFRGFVPPVGSKIDVTVALQDVSPKANGRPHSFRFSAIYIH